MQKCPNFIRNFWFKFFCQIFAKLLAKKRRVGEGVWRVWNLVCKAVWKKLKIAFLSEEPFMDQISFTICIIKQIFGEVFTSHIQLVLNIFVTPSALDWRDAFSGPRLWSWPYLQENSWCTVACMLLQSRKAGVKRWFFFGNNFLETIYSFWGRRCQVRFK